MTSEKSKFMITSASAHSLQESTLTTPTVTVQTASWREGDKVQCGMVWYCTIMFKGHAVGACHNSFVCLRPYLQAD